MSASKKGKPSPLKGKKRSPEFCAKISASLKGHSPSLETRAKLAAILAERNKSVEHRAKVGAALKGRPISEAHRKKLTGIKRSPELRARLSALKKEYLAAHPQSAEVRAKISAALKGKPRSQAAKDAIKAGRTRAKALREEKLLALVNSAAI